MKTSLYIDGFNFYYGCYRQSPRRAAPADKWLNFRLLANRLVGPDDTVHKVHYFTAYLYRSKYDPDQNLRQELYLRALRTVPSVEIHLGKHIPVERKGDLVRPDPASLGLWLRERVIIRTFEEKGSDVNLATQLLDDSYAGIVQQAIVVSNDTDLIAPIRSARKRIRVVVVSPQRKLAKELQKAADDAWCLDVGILKDCRLPNPVVDAEGRKLSPPTMWERETWDDYAGGQAEEEV